jgi:hypothetical protein
MDGSGYRLVEIFAIRPAGVPFDALEELATPGACRAARAAIAEAGALADAVQRAARAVSELDELPPPARQRLRRRLFQRAALPADVAVPPGPAAAALADYARLREAAAAAEARIDAALTEERAAASARLYALGAAHLPELAVQQLAGGSLATLLAHPSAKHDRTLALWLQRVCAKNDTISRFGPSAWGRIDPAEPGARLAPRPGIARRTAWVERWVVRAVIDAIQRDPDTRAELAPRAVAAGRDPAAQAQLAPDARALLARCDGRTPAHALAPAGAPAPLAQLAQLADAGLVRWRLEAVFIDNDPLGTLAADVAAWRPGPPRARWSAVVERLAALAAALAAAPDAAARGAAIAACHELLAELGAAPRARTGQLYEAANPLVENCSREGDFAVGAGPVAELLRDAAPWLDLFRDACALAALRVFEAVRPLYAEAPRRAGHVLIGDLLGLARSRGAELAALTPSRVAEAAFAEVRGALARRLAHRADAAEWELSADECAALRGAAPPRPELPYPSADLQLAAPSPEAIARGDYRWVVAELHTAFAPVAQSLSWSCPDRPRLAARFGEAHGGHPTVFFDTPGSGQGPVHVATELAIDGLRPVAFVTDDRLKPHWPRYAPEAVAVELDEERADLRLRCLATGRDLGTMLAQPRYFFGLHPFFPLQLEHHTPRLVRGRTILQRRAWLVAAEELPDALASPRQLVLAIERLRRARDLPRWVFLRLRADVLSGADAAARRKDAKPVCIDLESYVLMEVLARRIARYGRAELVEMVPAPHELWWREPDGRRCFELRTLLGPAAPGVR